MASTLGILQGAWLASIFRKRNAGMEVDRNMVGCIIAVTIGSALIVDFIVYLSILTRSSAIAAFEREMDDREQIEAIREYNRREAEQKDRRMDNVNK